MERPACHQASGLCTSSSTCGTLERARSPRLGARPKRPAGSGGRRLLTTPSRGADPLRWFLCAHRGSGRPPSESASEGKPGCTSALCKPGAVCPGLRSGGRKGLVFTQFGRPGPQASAESSLFLGPLACSHQPSRYRVWSEGNRGGGRSHCPPWTNNRSVSLPLPHLGSHQELTSPICLPAPPAPGAPQAGAAAQASPRREAAGARCPHPVAAAPRASCVHWLC